MVSEARKLHVIEEILKLNSESTLATIENFLKKGKKENRTATKAKSAFREFSGIWSKEEAAEIENIIGESCETVNPDDWK